MTTAELLGRRAAGLAPRVEEVRRRALPVLRAIRGVLAIGTPAGWAVALVGVVAFWAGGESGWLELRVAALACAGALVAAAAFTVGRSRYAVALDLQATRVVVGERAVGTVQVTSTAPRRLLPARIELPVGGTAAGFDLPSLSPGETHEDLFAIPTARRAVLVVGPVRSVRGDALGLLRRDVVWTDPVDLYVHPRTVRIEGTAAGFVHDLEGRPTRELSSDDMAFHTLRPYVAGDDRRHVHWKTSARTGTWMVRQFEQTRRSHLVVAMSTATDDYADADELELGVSACGSLGLQALRDEKALSVLTSERRLRIHTGRRLLDDLTAVETRSRVAPLDALARRTADEVRDATVVVLVCGSAPGTAELRRAASRFGAEVRVVVVRAATGEPVSCRTVGNAVVLTLDDLADLPAAVRRAATL
jgi:uncharacterized protein (DUF58 family)